LITCSLSNQLTQSNNLFNEQSIETNYSSNMSDKELVQFNTKCLTTNTMIKRRTKNSLLNPELVERGTNDLLKRQPIMNLPISPNFMQSNDVSVNLITSLNLFLKICLKSCIILQAPTLFTLWW